MRDVLLLGPACAATIRASLLGEMKMNYFDVHLDALNSLLTLEERHSLDKVGASITTPKYFPATLEVAGQFAAVLREASVGFGQRCRLLELFGAALPRDLVPTVCTHAKVLMAQDRFEALIRRLPESELIQHPILELAQQCSCSVRHFRRLFQAHFGSSVREKQTRLRMEKAKLLLLGTDAKVINVAYDCGYHSLGLFNLMFKKHYHMTPSAMRQQAARKKVVRRLSKAVAAMAVIPLLLMGLLCPRPAGGQEAAPNAPASPPRLFEVNRYNVEGNTILPPEIVDKVFADYTGKAVTLDRIRAALGELVLAYRGRGFVTVAVSLPPQTVTNGVVQVKVVEGRLTDIQVTGNRHFSSNNIMRTLPSLRTNILLNSLLFQQELDRANANRDRQIYPQIGPGPAPGTSSLVLKVKDRLPLHGRFEFNNYNTPGTPEMRMNSSIQYNNLWQLDHQVGLSYSFTPEEMKLRDHMPWRFFDQPALANYSLFYRAPLQLGRGERARREYGVGDFGYDEVTKRFRPPAMAGRPEFIGYASRSYIDSGVLDTINFQTNTGISTFTDQTFQQNLTINENVGWRIMLPLPDLGKLRSSLNFGFDFKSYRLRHYETNQISDVPIPPPPPAIAPPPTIVANAVPLNQPVSRSVNYLPFSLGWDGSREDKTGSTMLGVAMSFNFARLIDRSESFRRAAYAPQSDGNYFIANLSLTREQRIYEEWSVRFHADGQWANQALLSNEQFGLGGNAGVRGYQDGQEYGDTGWRVMLEPRPPPIALGLVDGSLPFMLRMSAFMDYGERYLLEPASGRTRRASLWGVGAAATATIGSRFDFRVMYGFALRGLPQVREGKGRLTFSLACQF